MSKETRKGVTGQLISELRKEGVKEIPVAIVNGAPITREGREIWRQAVSKLEQARVLENNRKQKRSGGR